MPADSPLTPLVQASPPREPAETIAASHFEARKGQLMQDDDGTVRLMLTVQPEDLPLWLMTLRPGRRVMIAAAEIDDDEMPMQRSTPQVRRKAVMSAALLCKEPRFQHYMERYDTTGLIDQARLTGSPAMIEEATAETLRRATGANSRGEIASSHDIYERFTKISKEFRSIASLPAAP